jgi:hypothetical protein
MSPFVIFRNTMLTFLITLVEEDMRMARLQKEREDRESASTLLPSPFSSLPSKPIFTAMYKRVRS